MNIQQLRAVYKSSGEEPRTLLGKFDFGQPFIRELEAVYTAIHEVGCFVTAEWIVNETGLDREVVDVALVLLRTQGFLRCSVRPKDQVLEPRSLTHHKERSTEMDRAQLKRIYEILYHLGGDASPQAIAQTLGVSVEKAEAGLDKLIALGLVEVSNAADLRYTTATA